MIDYEMLCQTIEDWRAGRRPSIDFSAPPAVGAAGYAEAEHGYGGEAEGGYEQAYAAPEPGYEQSGYEQSGYEGYEEAPEGEYEDYDEYGAPEPVAGSGTSPVDVGAEPPGYDEDQDIPDSVSLEDDDDPRYG